MECLESSQAQLLSTQYCRYFTPTRGKARAKTQYLAELHLQKKRGNTLTSLGTCWKVCLMLPCSPSYGSQNVIRVVLTSALSSRRPHPQERRSTLVLVTFLILGTMKDCKLCLNSQHFFKQLSFKTILYVFSCFLSRKAQK